MWKGKHDFPGISQTGQLTLTFAAVARSTTTAYNISNGSNSSSSNGGSSKDAKPSNTNLSNIEHDLIINFLLDGRMNG